MKKTVILISAIIMAVMLFTACGSDDDIQAEDTTTPAEAADAQAPAGDDTATAPAPVDRVPLSLEVSPPARATFATHENGSTFAITDDGTLWAWGYNSWGWLGDGTQSTRWEPVRVMDNVVCITATRGPGEPTIFAIDQNSTLWAWGSGGSIPSEDDRSNRFAPEIVMENVANVFPSYLGARIFVVDNDNVLWGWGSNRNQELEDSDVERIFTPIRFMDNVLAVDVSTMLISVLTTNGEVWSGREIHSLEYVKSNVAYLCTNRTSDREANFITQTGEFSRDFEDEIFVGVRSLASGKHSVTRATFVLTVDDQLYGFGSVDHWLGEAYAPQNRGRRPLHIMDSVDSIILSAPDCGGLAHPMFIDTNGILFIYGEGLNLAQPLAVMENVVTAFTSSPSDVRNAVDPERQSYFAITRDGTLWAWGHAANGRLGNGTNEWTEHPVAILENMMMP